MSNFNNDQTVVRQVQEAINAAGYQPALVVDGIDGPLTTAGIRWMQERAGSTIDGNITQEFLNAVGMSVGAPLTLSSSSGYAANPTYKTSPASGATGAPVGPVWVPPPPPTKEPAQAPKGTGIPLNVVNKLPPAPPPAPSKLPAAVGAAGGAGVGFLAAGPVGALVGAVVGGVAGFIYENSAASKKTPSTSIAGETDFMIFAQPTQGALDKGGANPTTIAGEGVTTKPGQPNAMASDVIGADPSAALHAQPNSPFASQFGTDVPTSRFGVDVPTSRFGGELRAAMSELPGTARFGCDTGKLR